MGTEGKQDRCAAQGKSSYHSDKLQKALPSLTSIFPHIESHDYIYAVNLGGQLPLSQKACWVFLEILQQCLTNHPLARVTKNLCPPSPPLLLSPILDVTALKQLKEALSLPLLTVPWSKSVPGPLCSTVSVFSVFAEQTEGPPPFSEPHLVAGLEAIIFVTIFHKPWRILHQFLIPIPVTGKQTLSTRLDKKWTPFFDLFFPSVPSTSFTPDNPHSFTKYNTDILRRNNWWILIMGW